ncbi:1,2-phenylacetyl-CoA epoxidase subunit PaaD [Alkalicoccus urumqiensis]|uniref:Phenylacetate-CoA oxygenase subunit PaaJ n=1 Tax=Alkalicoccus urumqiensis TaxID=1548213 RepID=A0A2P6ME19_ALKUR|nr:1,2-phenylacetyl-CoA epoxidase subunit PaaD [Alkalicoccus urumqiensis]PRO64517.1 phenylacetate-CoA oxygenase subunit PaaJ [Alkalicoccus urumqiensis]
MEAKKREVLEQVKKVDDPELPNVSVYDLGMVHEVQVEESRAHVTMIPTFAGCPALDFIKKNVETAVRELSWITGCEVTFSFNEIWSTDSVTEEGRRQLKKHGVAPPPDEYTPGEEWQVDCPYCGSAYVSMENVFGPTACRSILYCRSCRNPFEAMKPVIRDKTLAR